MPEAAQEREVLRSVVAADTRAVFLSIDYVYDSVASVLDAPVASRQAEELIRVRSQARQPVTSHLNWLV